MNKFASLIIFLLLLLSTAFAQLDPTFGTNGVTQIDLAQSERIIKYFVLPDNKILVVQSGDNLVNLIRLNSDGTFDNTYGQNGVILVSIPFINNTTKNISNALRQSDGKIVLVGNDNSDGFITRINENGVLDSGFASNGFHRPNFFNRFDSISSVFQQTDGKLVVFGYTENIVGTNAFMIRYSDNGNPDSGFGAGTGYIIYNFPPITSLEAKALQNGQFLLGLRPSITKINPDGSLDNTFTPIPYVGGGVGNTPRIAVLPDDKILILGDTVPAHPLVANQDLIILRYNANGSRDTTFGTNGSVIFDTGSYQNDYGLDISAESSGKIVVASYTNIQPNKSSRLGFHLGLIRLTANGVIEGKFIVTKSAFSRDFGQKITILPDGKILTAVNKNNDPQSFATQDIVLARCTGIPLENTVLHGMPYNFNEAGKSVASVFRPISQIWYANSGNLSNGTQFGLSDDIPVPSDYRANMDTEYAFFRPSNGVWHIALYYLESVNQSLIALQWGIAGDIPVPADFDGDSKSDVSVFRPSTGTWYIRSSFDNSPKIYQWGSNGDKPVIGDYDGDGHYDLAVWRPANGVWYIYQSSNNQPQITAFGLSGDIPIQDDYDGDGKTDIGVWRPSTGLWYIIKSSDSNYIISAFGLPTDVPVPADYDADGKTDLAVRRPSDNNYYILNSSNNSLSIYPYGTAGDIPLAGRY